MPNNNQALGVPALMPDNIQGILWALIAIVAAMAKVSITEFHILQILFFRQLIVFLSTLPTIIKSSAQSLKTKRPALHVARLIGAFIALSTSIWAVTVLQKSSLSLCWLWPS